MRSDPEPQVGRVMILIEFQRTAERLMALRTTTYTALTLEGIVGREDFRTGDPLPEFVYLVLYHGDGPWHATSHRRTWPRSWRPCDKHWRVDRFQQGLDELVQKGARQGQAQVLHRQVTRRFGEATAGALSGGRIQRTPSVESPTSYPDFADSGDRWPFLAETGGQVIEGTSSIARLTLGFVLPQVQMTREDLVKVDQAQALGTKPDGQLAGEALVPRLVPEAPDIDQILDRIHDPVLPHHVTREPFRG